MISTDKEGGHFLSPMGMSLYVTFQSGETLDNDRGSLMCMNVKAY